MSTKKAVFCIIFLALLPIKGVSKVSVFNRHGIVLKNSAKVFSKPSENSKTIKKLKKGIKVEIILKKYEDKNGKKIKWLGVKARSKVKGYILSKYVFNMKNFYRKWVLSVPKKIKGNILFYKNGTYKAVLNSYKFSGEVLKNIKKAKYYFITKGKFKIQGTEIVLSKSVMRNIKIKKLYLYRYKRDNFLTFDALYIDKEFEAGEFNKLWKYY